MPTYQVFAHLAIRELTISLFGIEIQVTHRLYKDPRRIIEARNQILNLRDSLGTAIEKQKAKKAGEEDQQEAISDLQQIYDQAEFALANNERYSLCETFCDEIAATNITDDEGNPMPLEPDALFNSEAQSEFLKAILDAVAAVPLVPKAK